MRVTVDLDPDVEALLREEMKRRQESLENVLNEAVRRALSDHEERFVVKARPLGLRDGIDPMNLGRLDHELQIDAYKEGQERLLRKLESERDPY